MKSHHSKNSTKTQKKDDFFTNNNDKLIELTALTQKISSFKTDECVSKLISSKKNYYQIIALFEQLQSISIYFSTDESLAAIANLAPEKAIHAHNIYKNIIISYADLFILTQDSLEQWKLDYLNFYISFFKKIAHIPLEAIHISISITIMLETIVSFLERLNENEIHELLKMGDDLFHSVEIQFAREKKQNSISFKKDCYSMMLSIYCFIFQVYPEQIALSKIMRLLNKSKNEKLKLTSSAYVQCIEVIANTIKPDFSVFYLCFNKCFKEIQKELGDAFENPQKLMQFQRILSAFQNALSTIRLRHHSESSDNILNKRSLNELMTVFNLLKTDCTTYSYLNMIEIMYLQVNLLDAEQLNMTYEYADHLLRLIEARPDLVDLDTTKNFCVHVLKLASAIDTPSLIELLPFFSLCLSICSPENIDVSIRQLLVNLLLKRREYPLETLYYLLQEVSDKIELKTHEIHRLLSNLMTLYPPQVSNIFLLELCNKFKNTIATDKNLTTLIVKCDKTFLETLEDSKHLIQKQNEYQTLQLLASDVCQEIVNVTETAVFNKIKLAAIALIQSIENDQDDIWSFEEGRHFIEQFRDEYGKLYELNERASCNDISLKSSLDEFLAILKQEKPSIDHIKFNISSYQQKVNEALEQIKEDESHRLAFEDAQIMLRDGSFENLIKINLWLRAPGKDKELLLMKIRCLKKLGYHEQALAWLERANIIFSKDIDIQFFALWAECCLSIGQYQTALETYQHIYERSNKKNKNYNLRMQIGFCHQMLGGAENYTKAISIYSELKEQLTKTLDQVRDRKYREKLTHHLKRVCIAEIRCLIFNNRLSEAEVSLQVLHAPEIEKMILQAELYQMQTHHKEASVVYEHALQQQFHFKWMKALLNCYVLSRQLNAQKIGDFLSLLDQHKQDTPEYYEIKVNVFMHRKEYRLALNELKMMKHTWGISQFICVQESRCYAKLGETKESIAILTSFPDYRKNKVVLKQLAVSYAQDNMQEHALDCFDYLLTEYPMFIPSYNNAILYSISIMDKARVSRYWTQYNEVTDKHDSQLYKILKHKVESYLADELYGSNFEATGHAEKLSFLEESSDLDDDFNGKKYYLETIVEESSIDLAVEDPQEETELPLNISNISIFIQKNDSNELHNLTLNTKK